MRVGDLTKEQKKADADVEQVRARRTRDQDRLDRGSVSNPRDLEHLQSELVSLQRRIIELEDVELEVMEQLETAQQEQASVRGRLAELDQRIADATARRDQRAAALQQEAARVSADRATAVQGMPEDLLALYERLRTQKGGVGAAALRARRCSGCSLELNSGDLATIAKKPVDEVVRCEECSRILVRTSESGL